MTISTKVSDKSVLADLEYRGMSDFVNELYCGLSVPTSMVDRIKRIVKKHMTWTLL